MYHMMNTSRMNWKTVKDCPRNKTRSESNLKFKYSCKLFIVNSKNMLKFRIKARVEEVALALPTL